MAVLVLDEIDLWADSRDRHVSLGMSIRFRNSGSLSKTRHSLMAGSLVNSKVLTIESLARSLQWGRNGSLRTSGWYTVARVQHRGRLSHLLMYHRIGLSGECAYWDNSKRICAT